MIVDTIHGFFSLLILVYFNLGTKITILNQETLVDFLLNGAR